MTATPLWMRAAKTYVGLKEIPGPRHNKVILGWLRDLKAWWADDETPWCGTFVAHCLEVSGQPVPKLWMRAKAWADYGKPVPRDNLAPGTILVFNREGGGHVGFYTGEDQTHYYVLGGNQNNGVNVTRILKSRLIASRWPSASPVTGKPVYYLANAASVPVTSNER